GWCEELDARAAGFRVLKWMPGIGPSTAAKILDQVEAEPHASRVLDDIKVPRATAEDWPALAKLFEQMRQGKTMWPAEFELVREWYAPHLERIYDDAQLRAADVAQLAQIAAGHGARGRVFTQAAPGPPDGNYG